MYISAVLAHFPIFMQKQKNTFGLLEIHCSPDFLPAGSQHFAYPPPLAVLLYTNIDIIPDKTMWLLWLP